MLIVFRNAKVGIYSQTTSVLLVKLNEKVCADYSLPNCASIRIRMDRQKYQDANKNRILV